MKLELLNNKEKELMDLYYHMEQLKNPYEQKSRQYHLLEVEKLLESVLINLREVEEGGKTLLEPTICM